MHVCLGVGCGGRGVEVGEVGKVGAIRQLELQMTENHNVGSGNQPHVLKAAASVLVTAQLSLQLQCVEIFQQLSGHPLAQSSWHRVTVHEKLPRSPDFPVCQLQVPSKLYCLDLK